MKRKTNAFTIAALAVFTLGTGSVLAQNTFTTSANLGTNNDTWTAADNWTGADFPKDTDEAVIQTGLTALANSTAVETYSGGLTIEENATLQIGAGGSTENRTQSALALGTGPITMEAGSKIQWQMKVSPTPPSITLNGDASIVQASNESHNRQFTFANGISGPGQLTFLGVNNGNHSFTVANPDWSGGFVAGVEANTRTRFNANAAGVFGTGDVTIGAFTDLVIGSAGDAIDDGATLTIDGAGRDQSPATKLIMNGSDTVGFLVRDGDPYPAGTYSRIGGGGDIELSWISGNGILTVADEPEDTTAPTLTGITDPVSDFTTDFYTGSSITYTLTFDELVTTATTPSPADFENVGDAPVTIDSVTQPGTDPVNVILVTVTANGTGTLQLGAKSSALFEDLFGNTLSGPFTDDVVFNVLTGPTPSLTISGGDWHVGTNWDSGFPPFMDYPAIVASGVTALANNTAVGTYSGGLTIEENATLQIGSGGSTENRTQSALALGTGTITMESGSSVIWWLKANPPFPPLQLDGDAGFVFTSTESHNRTWQWTSVSGSGLLSIDGTNNSNFQFVTNANPSWSGGLVVSSSSGRSTVFANVAGCFGTGDVTIEANTSLQISASGGCIDDGANLILNGPRRDNAAAKLILSQSETVNECILDGVNLAAGDYTNASGLLDSSGVNLISGGGTLTVLSGGGGPSDPYDTWATGGELFGDDANGDGVSNGLAFLLGAASPTADALGLLPTVTETGGGLVLTFSMLDAASRGTATLNVEHSSDLGIADPWTTVAVPDTSGGPTGGVTFVVSGSGTLAVEATIGSGEAAGGKLFGRLKAEKP